MRKKLISRLILILGLLVVVWLTIIYWVKTVIIVSTYLPQKTTIENLVSPEEYEVYSAVIKTKLTRFSTELILIENMTETAGTIENLSPNNPWSPIVSNEVWDNYYSRNQKNFELSKSFSLNRPYFLVKQNRRENMNRMLLITKNINATPFLQFSRVGFNSNGDKALVLVGEMILGGRIFGYLPFAFGIYFYLEKIEGRWIIRDEWQSFIT